MTTDHMRLRIERADPLIAIAVDTATSEWGVALAEAVMATDPAAPAGRSHRRLRPALRLTLAAVAVAGITTGVAVGAYELLRPSPAVERGVQSLTLPAPDLDGLAAIPGTLRPVLSTTAEGTIWGVWTVRTEGRGTLVVLASRSAGEAERVTLGGCPELDPGAGGAPCVVSSSAAGAAVAGRTAPDAASVRAVFPDGVTVDGVVREGVYLVVAPAVEGGALPLPVRVEPLDENGASITSPGAGTGG